MKKLVMLLIILSLSGLAFAAGKDSVRSMTLPDIKTELKAGEGRDTTERNCSICHSLDYIVMQPAFPRAKWAAIVNKMRKVMGAPIPENDAEAIIGYLAAEYGTGN